MTSWTKTASANSGFVKLAIGEIDRFLFFERQSRKLHKAIEALCVILE
jgi:hypothetical protein